jgi:hypothetical protein
MKTDFLLVTASDYVAFQDRVNKLLGKGYQILGSPFSHGAFVCVGMLKSPDAYYPPAEYAAAPEGQQ